MRDWSRWLEELLTRLVCGYFGHQRDYTTTRCLRCGKR